MEVGLPRAGDIMRAATVASYADHMADTSGPAAQVRRFLELATSRRADEAAELLAEDVEWRNSGWPTIRGADRVGSMLREMDRRGIEFEAEVHHLAADGEHVLTVRTDRLGYKRLRTAFPVQGTFRVADDRIVLWDDHFSQVRALTGLVRNLLGAPSR
jgi:limonene-1,2-epoxide hydrolase